MNREERSIAIRKKRYRQILDAAEKVFARQGYGSTKVSAIAREAGVSYGLVYEYFETKEKLFSTLVSGIIMEMGEISLLFRGSGLSALEQIKKTLELFVEENRKSVKAGEAPFKFLIMIQAMSLESARDMLNVDEVVRNPLFLGLKNLIERGQEEGTVIQGDPRMLSHTLMSAMLGVALSSIPPFDVKYLPTADTLLRLIRKE